MLSLMRAGSVGGVLSRLCSPLQVAQALHEVHVGSCFCSACLSGGTAFSAQLLREEEAEEEDQPGFQGDGRDVEVPLYNYQMQQIGVRHLPGDIFNIEVRKDILHRVVRWQLAKRQQGTHLAKGRAEVRGGGRKPWKQKGTGRARQGSIRSPQWRGGGVVHGPVLRSHEHDLPKKVRRLGLKCALSAKASEGRLLLVDSLALPEPKTRLLDERLDMLLAGAPRRSVLMGDSSKQSEDGGEDLRLAAANLAWVDVLPQEGLNVYSILQRDHLVLTENALDLLTERLRLPIFRGPIDRAQWAKQVQAAAAEFEQAAVSTA